MLGLCHREHRSIWSEVFHARVLLDSPVPNP